jgi:putative effector of murein hydrolase
VTRVLGWLLLLAGGAVSLPLAATFLDGQGTENWILPVAVVATALLGALLGAALPGFVAGETRRRVAVGAAYGVAAAAIGVLVFFVLLSGFDGA